MEKILALFERYTVFAIIVMMMVTILVSTVELGVILITELFKPPRFLLDITNLLEVFGFFFMILIGLELLHTIKTYLSEESVHVEIVFLVAMIAIARKIIVLELSELDPVTLLGMAAIILALTGGYYFIKRAYNVKQGSTPSSGPKTQTAPKI